MFNEPGVPAFKTAENFCRGLQLDNAFFECVKPLEREMHELLQRKCAADPHPLIELPVEIVQDDGVSK